MGLGLTARDFILGIPAFGGLILGILNMYFSWRKEKLSLKVRTIFVDMGPGYLQTMNNPRTAKNHLPYALGVSIVNNSKFDVTVTELGFRSTKRDDIYFCPYKLYPSYGNRCPPLTLSQNGACELYIPLDFWESEGIPSLKYLVVQTECGHIVKAKNKGMLKLLKQEYKKAMELKQEKNDADN